jgi:hypothetical protein
MSYWTGDNWLDGPTFAEWLDEHGYVPGDVPASLARRVLAWRGGSRARLERADELLALIGHHPGDVPDEVWNCSQEWGRGGAAGPRRDRVAA